MLTIIITTACEPQVKLGSTLSTIFYQHSIYEPQVKTRSTCIHPLYHHSNYSVSGQSTQRTFSYHICSCNQCILLQSASQSTTIHLQFTNSINSHNINILSIHQPQSLFPNTTIKPSKWFRDYDELALLENQPTKQNN